MIIPTEPQAEAIAEQALVYAQPDTPCVGLHHHRLYNASEQWTSFPAGAVAVDFWYVREDDESGHYGLETTVFGLDGSVLNSQDFG